jgi:hypothetical protein
LETTVLYGASGVGKSSILRAGVALALFRQAAAEERVTLQLPRALAAYLDRARRNPALRFEPAG